MPAAVSVRTKMLQLQRSSEAVRAVVSVRTKMLQLHRTSEAVRAADLEKHRPRVVWKPVVKKMEQYNYCDEDCVHGSFEMKVRVKK